MHQLIGYKMFIHPPKIPDYFSIKRKNTHTLPASSERASTHSVDKGKIWCVENCRQGERKLHQVPNHYPCPMLFHPKQFSGFCWVGDFSLFVCCGFFPHFWGSGRNELAYSLYAPSQETADRNHASHSPTANTTRNTYFQVCLQRWKNIAS